MEASKNKTASQKFIMTILPLFKSTLLIIRFPFVSSNKVCGFGEICWRVCCFILNLSKIMAHSFY